MFKNVIIAILSAKVLMAWDFFIAPTPADKALLFGMLVSFSMIGIVTLEEWYGKIRKVLFERR